MKLRELSSILYSTRGNIQFCIVYDSEKRADIENGCSVEYAIDQHGDKTVKHLEAFEHQLLITV